ncbi:MAG: SphA family protein [Alphaproteobacteria bacterium]
MKWICRLKRATPFCTIAAAALNCTPGYASEYGFSVYGLGGAGPLAGIVPPPGTYFADTFIHGNFTADIVPARGRIQASLKATMNINAFTLQHVTDWKILGADYGFRITVPLSSAKITAEVRSTQFGIGASTSDSKTAIGDLNVTPIILGWHAGAWHWQTYVSFVAPTGFYDINRLIFTGLNRWAVDFGGGFTWLDPKIGFEVSVQVGYTVNFENPATDYLTGNEFHGEFFLGQHLPFGGGTVSIGLAGYALQQVTGDSGSGARLGSFKGRTIALGPSLNFNSLNLGGPKVSIAVRYYHEFAIQRRLAGDVFMASLSFKF